MTGDPQLTAIGLVGRLLSASSPPKFVIGWQSRSNIQTTKVLLDLTAGDRSVRQALEIQDGPNGITSCVVPTEEQTTTIVRLKDTPFIVMPIPPYTTADIEAALEPREPVQDEATIARVGTANMSKARGFLMIFEIMKAGMGISSSRQSSVGIDLYHAPAVAFELDSEINIELKPRDDYSDEIRNKLLELRREVSYLKSSFDYHSKRESEDSELPSAQVVAAIMALVVLGFVVLTPIVKESVKSKAGKDAVIDFAAPAR